MDENTNQVAPEEVQAPVEEQVSEPDTEETTENPKVQETPPKETDAQINYRAMRDLKKKAERERDELLARLKLSEQQQPKQPQTQQPEEFAVAPDDLVEGKHLSAVDKKVKQLESQLKTYQQQASAQSVEARIKAQYPDFEQVVSQENLEVFRTAYPDIAASIGTSTDLYSKAISAYKLIKTYNIHQHKEAKADATRVQNNLSKPVSTASLGAQQGDSPLAKANAFSGGLTQDLKDQLMREMNDAIKSK